jgi:chromosomal replication initiator protein
MQPRGRKKQPDQPAGVPPQDALKQSILIDLQQRVGTQNYKNWFRDKTVIAIFEDELIVRVGSPFLQAWMQKKFRAEATATAQAILGPSARVRFEVDAQLPLRAVPLKVEPETDRDPGSRNSGSNGMDEKKRAGDTPLQSLKANQASTSPRTVSNRRRFSKLADFVEGSCNALAVTASRQICESPGSRLNPLVLYGGVGTGKTHLLEGIYCSLRRGFPALQVMYLTAESFANYFTQALRERTLPSFRQRFRNVDVFLVDDVNFFDSKRVIQEEFLHTFKQLEGHGRQLVLSCDSHPRLLSKTSDELVTRFLSGLVCRLESPDVETRRKIVELKASRMNADFSKEALALVAQRFKNNVRELEGAVNCLSTYHCMTGKRINLSTARKVLSDLERDCVRVVRLSDVEQVVCEFFGLNSAELKSSKRHRSISRPRMLAMYLARKHTQAAYSEIGQFFGGRNHATVMSAEKNVNSWISEGREFKVASHSWQLDEVIETLEHQLQAS